MDDAAKTNLGAERGAMAPAGELRPGGPGGCGHADECAALRERIAEVKDEILATLVEIEDIRLQINPSLESDYAVKVGYLENDVLMARVAMRRAKRRLALAQAAVNVGGAVDEAAIGQVIDAEFAEWEQLVAAAVEGYYLQLERRASMQRMSPGDSRELKRVYRALVKRLHPDANPDQPENDARLFLIAQSAYADGDLDALRSLHAVLGCEAGDDEGASEDAIELAASIVVLELQLETHRRSLAELKEAFPYSFREKLGDAMWLSRRTAELREERGAYAKAEAEYAERYGALVAQGFAAREVGVR